MALPGGAATTVTANPGSLTFTWQSGSATLPPSQSISVKASSGTPAFAASILPSAAAVPWLTVASTAVALPATLAVYVNPETMPIGVYSTASISISVAGVAAPVSIAVTLTVTAPPANLGLSANTLTFDSPANTNPQIVTLSTDGLPISFTATSGAKWLDVNTSTSQTPAGTVTGVVSSAATPVSLTASLDPVGMAALAPQTAPYVGKITIVASGPPVAVKSQTITVNLTVNALAPTIASVWPTSLPLGGGAAWVTIIGTNFYSATVVEVQGVNGTLTPKLLSTTELSVQIPASMLTAPTTLNLIAENPPPGGQSAVMGQSAITVSNPTAIYANGVVSAASYASDAVSPGELVTIFGTNIGPNVPAPMTISNGYVGTSLGGVTATVDGETAPIIYASLNQVTIQIPYEANPGPSKVVSLKNGNNPAVTALVQINPTAPGIFTANGSGTGPAAALNYNATTGLYTLNSSTTPANIGDTVILYLTGEGNYIAGLLTGAVTTNSGFIIPESLNPLPEMNPLPLVNIGGVDASAGVAYAGPMVGGMLGLLQINVTVPTGSATGAAVPIYATIGGVSTQVDQPNVTLAIHP